MSIDPEQIGRLYTENSDVYAAFKESSYAWAHIEQPGFDKYMSDVYGPESRILDLGCGAGLMIKHLISRGCLATNLTGVDISDGLVQIAREEVPEATFQVASADNFAVPAESFDAVTSNMVVHYLNDEQLARSFELIYNALKPSGIFCLVDTDPDYSPQSRDPDNIGRYIEAPAPWGGTMPMFVREPITLLDRIPYFAGFDVQRGWTLENQDSEPSDQKNYVKYSQVPGRLAVRFKKVSREQKQFRLDNRGRSIPSLTAAYDY